MNVEGSEFERRWRRLAQEAREMPRAEFAPLDISRRARRRALEALPLVSERVAWCLAATAAVITVLLAPRVFAWAVVPPTLVVITSSNMPPPPTLPPPPSLESPSYYLAAAGAAWKELTP